jgi:hypothetical protein
MMDGMGRLLADIPGFGRVYDCGSCGGVHVSIGQVSVTLTPDAYLQFVTLIHTSAANFEVWMERKRSAFSGACKEEAIHVDPDVDANQS